MIHKKNKKLLLIPGMLCDSTLWEPSLPYLKDIYNCQIIDISQGKTIHQLAEAVWHSAESEVILAAFSLGAWIALQAYALHPERCQALVLISSAPGNLADKTRQLFLSYITQIQSGKFEKFIEADFAQDIAPQNQKNISLKTAFATMMHRQGQETAIRQLSMMLNFSGDFFPLNQIHCPKFLMRGQEDHSVNLEKQQQMQKEIPHAELCFVPNAAHYLPLENPIAVAQFLREIV